ncbi:unnamed protein product, partial [Thlaspi arvense]
MEEKFQFLAVLAKAQDMTRSKSVDVQSKVISVSVCLKSGNQEVPSQEPPATAKALAPTIIHETPQVHQDSALSSPGKKWSALFEDSTSLQSIGTPTTHASGVPFILIPDENLDAAKEEFKDFIFAQFHGQPPEMGRIIGVINAIWARTGPRIFVHRIGSGTFLLRNPDFNPKEAPITKAQVMVEFRGIPYLFFNKESLGRIASGAGDPKALSPETARKETFEVVKILVEVDLLKELPTKLIFGLTNGKEFEVTVSYPWLPPKCGECGNHGHASSHCIRRPPPNQTKRKPQSRSRSRAPSKGKVRGRSKSKAPRRSSSRPRDPAPPFPKGSQRATTKDSKGRGAAAVAALLEQHVPIKHVPPQHPFFLITRRKSGRKDMTRAWINSHKRLYGAFTETHIQPSNSRRIENAIPRGWSYHGNFSAHHTARIVVVWDPRATVVVYKESLQMVTCGANLFEAPSKGLTYSWWNKHDQHPVSKRIDHALINEYWASKFPDAFSELLDPLQSDHSPILFAMPTLTRGSCKPFRFFCHVVDHEEYPAVVSESWNPAAIMGSAQFKLLRCLKLLKPALKRINKNHFSILSRRVKEQEMITTGLQRQLLTSPNPLLANEERNTHQRWNALLKAEEKFFRQRSRVKWLHLGDRNTSFYHKMVTMCLSKNHIYFLRNVQGQRLASSAELKQYAAEYFMSIFGCTDMPISPSEIFFSGYPASEATSISAEMGIKIGTFPTRYLGLPLSSQRLTFSVMQPFLEKIKRKLHAWTTKFLSFAGKIKLISSEVYGMVNFWSQVYMLPKEFYAKVDSLCAAFLWKNTTHSAAGARVAWEEICKPKSEGGLGIRLLADFEKVFRLKQTWNLFANSGSLWVAWVNRNIFNRKSYWVTGDSPRFSRAIRCMLQQKHILSTFLKCEVKDGSSVSFWWDSWTDLGPLIHYIGVSGPVSLRLRIDAKVVDATRVGSWNMANARSNEIQNLQILLTTISPPEAAKGQDIYRWRNPAGTYSPAFSSKGTWEQLRTASVQVPWANV